MTSTTRPSLYSVAINPCFNDVHINFAKARGNIDLRIEALAYCKANMDVIRNEQPGNLMKLKEEKDLLGALIDL
jgi:hypothetical protein